MSSPDELTDDLGPTDAAEPHIAGLYQEVGLGPPVYRRADVVRLAGIEHERSVRWWRAMGFAEVPEDVPAFAELDIEIAKRLAALAGAGLVADSAITRLARVLGASFSRIAEAQVAAMEHIADTFSGSDGDALEHSAAVLATFDESMLDLLEDSLVYVWRRHLLAALGRRLETDASSAEQAVGFADLSGFTKLSQRLSPERLGELVDDFENTAFDVVSSHPGRAVKLIGDEIMFVSESLSSAVDIGLDLADRLCAIADMPDIHCGIAYGPTVTVGGDVFGSTVNLAARLTTIARRGTIVIPHANLDHLGGREDLVVREMRRTFDLKGIGRTRVVAVRRAS